MKSVGLFVAVDRGAGVAVVAVAAGAGEFAGRADVPVLQGEAEAAAFVLSGGVVVDRQLEGAAVQEALSFDGAAV